MTPRIETAALQALVEHATPGPWTAFNMIHADRGDAMTPEEIGEYVCDCVRKGDLDRFLFVSGKHDDGGTGVICLTGNGPRGPWNTALIAAVPALAAEVLEAREVTPRYVAQVDRLTTERDALQREVERLRAVIEPFEGAAGIFDQNGKFIGGPSGECLCGFITGKDLIEAVKARRGE